MSEQDIERRTELRHQFTDDAREIRLSKSDGAQATKLELREFHMLLSGWAERLGKDGYLIEASPLEGPGTMRWLAISPAEQAKRKIAGADL